jgi:hypothetical protein
MTRALGRAAVLSGLSLVASLAGAAEVRRLALVAGANRGHPDRLPLRYAVADAERFAGVLTRLGGVAPTDCVTLKDPSRRAFLDALAVLRDRVGARRQGEARAEVVLYYSGHADESGLMLGRERISYRELRDEMHAVAAEVGITVLDACASGAITRLKDGRPRPAFLTDDSMRMQGHAFLTSSSENEAAQESERLQGRRAEIAVEPGAYEVHYEEEKQLFAREVRVAEGERREVAREELGPTSRAPTRVRGPSAASTSTRIPYRGRRSP